MRLSARLRNRLQTWMLRGRMREPLPITLQQKRIYILPTAEGCGFAMLLLAMLLASLNYNLSLGFALTFALVGVGHVAMLRTHGNLLALTLAYGRSEPVHAGEQIRFELGFAESAGRPREALTIGLIDRSGETISVPARGQASVALLALPEQRGRYHIGRIRIETRYPLGLVRAWSYLEPDLAEWVFPAIEDAPPMPPSHGERSGMRRSHASGNDHFDSLRPYRPGDSPRVIAWRRLARGGPPASKVFLADTGSESSLRWDDCPPAFDTEARLSRLCAWALAAENEGRAWGLEIPGCHLEPGRGPAHLRQALEALAGFGIPHV